jgi:hypothetical protein
MDPNNFVAPEGSGFAVYRNGQKVGSYASQNEAENAFNAAGASKPSNVGGAAMPTFGGYPSIGGFGSGFSGDFDNTEWVDLEREKLETQQVQQLWDNWQKMGQASGFQLPQMQAAFAQQMQQMGLSGAAAKAGLLGNAASTAQGGRQEEKDYIQSQFNNMGQQNQNAANITKSIWEMAGNDATKQAELTKAIYAMKQGDTEQATQIITAMNQGNQAATQQQMNLMTQLAGLEQKDIDQATTNLKNLNENVAQQRKEVLDTSYAQNAVDQTALGASNKIVDTGVKLAEMQANMRGPRNAFQQQAMMQGLNADGLSNAMDAMMGKFGASSVPGGPQANNEAATLATANEDMMGAGTTGNSSALDNLFKMAKGRTVDMTGKPEYSDPSAYQALIDRTTGAADKRSTEWGKDLSTTIEADKNKANTGYEGQLGGIEGRGGLQDDLSTISGKIGDLTTTMSKELQDRIAKGDLTTAQANAQLAGLQKRANESSAEYEQRFMNEYGKLNQTSSEAEAQMKQIAGRTAGLEPDYTWLEKGRPPNESDAAGATAAIWNARPDLKEHYAKNGWDVSTPEGQAKAVADWMTYPENQGKKLDDVAKGYGFKGSTYGPGFLKGSAATPDMGIPPMGGDSPQSMTATKLPGMAQSQYSPEMSQMPKSFSPGTSMSGLGQVNTMPGGAIRKGPGAGPAMNEADIDSHANPNIGRGQPQPGGGMGDMAHNWQDDVGLRRNPNENGGPSPAAPPNIPRDGGVAQQGGQQMDPNMQARMQADAEKMKAMQNDPVRQAKQREYDAKLSKYGAPPEGWQSRNKYMMAPSEEQVIRDYQQEQYEKEFGRPEMQLPPGMKQPIANAPKPTPTFAAPKPPAVPGQGSPVPNAQYQGAQGALNGNPSGFNWKTGNTANQPVGLGAASRQGDAMGLSAPAAPPPAPTQNAAAPPAPAPAPAAMPSPGAVNPASGNTAQQSGINPNMEGYKSAFSAANGWNPKKVVGRNFNKMNQDTKDFLLSGAEKAGWSANDIQDEVKRGMPKFAAPKVGMVR